MTFKRRFLFWKIRRKPRTEVWDYILMNDPERVTIWQSPAGVVVYEIRLDPSQPDQVMVRGLRRP